MNRLLRRWWPELTTIVIGSGAILGVHALHLDVHVWLAILQFLLIYPTGRYLPSLIRRIAPTRR